MPMLINSPGILLTCPLTALTERRNQGWQPIAIRSGCLRGREGPTLLLTLQMETVYLALREGAFVKETDGSHYYLRAEAFLAARRPCLSHAFPLMEPGRINPEWFFRIPRDGHRIWQWETFGKSEPQSHPPMNDILSVWEVLDTCVLPEQRQNQESQALGEGKDLGF